MRSFLISERRVSNRINECVPDRIQNNSQSYLNSSLSSKSASEESAVVEQPLIFTALIVCTESGLKYRGRTVATDSRNRHELSHQYELSSENTAAQTSGHREHSGVFCDRTGEWCCEQRHEARSVGAKSERTRSVSMYTRVLLPNRCFHSFTDGESNRKRRDQTGNNESPGLERTAGGTRDMMAIVVTATLGTQGVQFIHGTLYPFA